MSRNHNPDYVDWDAYAQGRYTPPPQLEALAKQDPFWRNLGGTTDGFAGAWTNRHAKQGETYWHSSSSSSASCVQRGCCDELETTK